jgi:hypothetical protein
MKGRRLLCAVLTAAVLLAAGCGGGDNGEGNTDRGGRDNGGGTSQGGGGGGGENGGGDADDESGFAVNTELDLGQAFAEEPMFDKRQGSLTLNVRTDRGGGMNAEVPITFLVINSGNADLRNVTATIRFMVLPGKDPEDPPVPAPTDPPLDFMPQTTTGTCAAEDATPSSTAIACSLGTLASGAEETITVTSPKWFRLSTEMEFKAGGS